VRYRSKGHDVVCPLDPRLREHLRELAARIHPGAEDLVLANPDTGRAVDNWRTQWKRIVRLANATLKEPDRIPEATPIHALRHSRISHLLLAGVSLQAVAESTGTSAVMIQRHYAHLLTRSLEKELARARRHPALRIIDRAAKGPHS